MKQWGLSAIVRGVGSVSILRAAMPLGMSIVKRVGILQVTIMEAVDRRNGYWRTIRKNTWAKKKDGTWVYQRGYTRVWSPDDRSRARDHTKVTSNKIIRSVYKKKMCRYWATLDSNILAQAQANSKYVKSPDPS